jgi:hypothetical protein
LRPGDGENTTTGAAAEMRARLTTVRVVDATIIARPVLLVAFSRSPASTI